MRPVTRALRGLSLLAVAAIALAGCSGGQVQPSSYGEVNEAGEGYYGNFMAGCTGVAEPPFEGGELASSEFCRCVYEGMKETVPFADAKAFEEAQAETPEDTEITIPKAIRTVMDGCGDAESGEA